MDVASNSLVDSTTGDRFSLTGQPSGHTASIMLPANLPERSKPARPASYAAAGKDCPLQSSFYVVYRYPLPWFGVQNTPVGQRVKSLFFYVHRQRSVDCFVVKKFKVYPSPRSPDYHQPHYGEDDSYPHPSQIPFLLLRYSLKGLSHEN